MMIALRSHRSKNNEVQLGDAYVGLAIAILRPAPAAMTHTTFKCELRKTAAATKRLTDEDYEHAFFKDGMASLLCQYCYH